jgi:hypothetical protein
LTEFIPLNPPFEKPSITIGTTNFILGAYDSIALALAVIATVSNCLNFGKVADIIRMSKVDCIGCNHCSIGIQNGLVATNILTSSEESYRRLVHFGSLIERFDTVQTIAVAATSSD